MAVECTAPVLNRLSLLDSGARLIGVASFPDQKLPEKPDRVLLLDGVQDPGNLGTLIRSAVGFGIQLVLCSGDCADPFGPKALQSSQGSVFHVPVIRCRLSAAVEELKTRMPVFAAALHHDSISLSSLRISGPWALVLGNEGQGIQEALINQCTETVYIEMDAFESLNVAVAGSILMYCLRYRTERDNP
nr:RNA methyltransferase [Faecalibaculum rodentium]